MKTSQEWWQETKNNPEQLVAWLKKQYHGEITAAQRIHSFVEEFAQETPWKPVLEKIAEQEVTHAGWVGELLTNRGITPKVLEKKERYWDKTLPSIDSFERGAAVAAHAETMRLHRIEAIADDEEAPEDIREVFQKILPQERFHAKAFSEMAGEKAMAVALKDHHLGMEAIGLIPV